MKHVVLAGLVSAVASVASADIVTFYSNDFESALKVGPEWVSSPVWNTTTNFSGFIGRFTQETHVLQIAALHPHKPNGGGDQGGGNGCDQGGGGPGDGGDQGGGPGGSGGSGGPLGGGRTATTRFTLEFDLYLIDSWDGGFAGAYGPDYFGVRVNGDLLLWEAFHSVKVEQNFMQPTLGPVHLGFNSAYKDSIFRNIALEFELSRDVDVIRIEFIGAPSSNNFNDESWAIDNVHVGAHVVPAPGVLAIGAGVLGLGLRRRRG